MLNSLWKFLNTLVIMCLLASCSSEESYDKAMYATESPSAPTSKRTVVADFTEEEYFAEDVVGSTNGTNATPSSVLTTLGATPSDRQLIKNASLSIEVDNAPVIAQTITANAVAKGGYIADTSRQKIGDNRFLISMTVRIPSGKFDQTAEEFQGLGTVLSFTANAQDVTEEYVDTESRARNLRHSEERLLEHLKRSAKLEDILKAEKEITRVRGEIEQLDGRLRYLSNRVAYSSIYITLNDKPGPEQVTPKESYSAMHIVSQASRSLIEFARLLLTLCIWVGVWSPIWLPIVIVVAVVRRRRKVVQAN